MEIGSSCFNTIKNNLEICNYPKLEKLVIKQNSFKCSPSLKICNNDLLHTIQLGVDNVNSNTFERVKDLTIQSILSDYNNTFQIFLS